MAVVKITDFEGIRKAGIVANSVSQLHEKARKIFSITNDEEVKIVLASDGTLIVDDEFLQHLPKDSLVVLLRKREQWELSKFRVAEDEIDANLSPFSILQLVAGDPSKMLLLDDIQLELICECDLDTDSARYSLYERIQDSCQRLLADRRDSREVSDLVKMLTDN
ncbi:uncharacterized protein LOC136043293 [Artemia franciscana]|uniref:CIDE-N domain-containing protein n=1 Tax=Artemia franciscana TaxID=6661 RepID=A0AA88HU19_ARTSF|nr:hypothetical protein QYM36_010679 [Artemia franciscana]